MRECPLLSKFYISEQEEDWERKVCLNCVISPICVLELAGRIPAILKEKLEQTMVPCPKCQGDPIIWNEVMRGDRISGLRLNEDGDWQCFYCSHTIYRPVLDKKKRR